MMNKKMSGEYVQHTASSLPNTEDHPPLAVIPNTLKVLRSERFQFLIDISHQICSGELRPGSKIVAIIGSIFK